jgi:hypothetical protein
MLGGVVLVGFTYWFIYLRPEVRTTSSLQTIRHENDPPRVLLEKD